MPVTGDSSCDSSDAEDDHHHHHNQLLARGDQLALMPPFAAAAPPSPSRFLTNNKPSAFLLHAVATNTASPLTLPRHGPAAAGADQRNSGLPESSRPSPHLGRTPLFTNRNLLLSHAVDNASSSASRLIVKQQQPGNAFNRPAGEGGMFWRIIKSC